MLLLDLDIALRRFPFVGHGVFGLPFSLLGTNGLDEPEKRINDVRREHFINA